MHPFLLQTNNLIISYISMKVLLPSSSEQTIKIIPRSYVEASDLSLVIKQDGTNNSQTLSSLTSTIVGNYLSIPCTFTILSEGSLYSMEINKVAHCFLEIRFMLLHKQTEHKNTL